MKRAWWLGLTVLVLALSACPSTGIVCRVGTQRCGNGCADFSSDSRNCGSCGVPCLGSQICSSGECVCRAGTTLCNGQCVVIENDPQNCGACGNACGVGDGGFARVCEDKVCRDDCSQGTQCAGGSCARLDNDPLNCGACGNVCPDSQSCRGGACTWDLVAACLTNGQIAGLQSGSDLRGPLVPMGSGPISLAPYGRTLLVADTYENRLLQARLPSLQALSEYNDTGAGVNHVLVEAPFVYAVNSTGHTVQVLRPLELDAGCAPVTPPDAGCAVVALSDGGVLQPSMGDGGCFFPAPTDGGCAPVLLEDGGLGPLATEDGGCFAVPPPVPPVVQPCFQMGTDAGLRLVTVGAIDTGMNTFPQAAAKVGSALWVPLWGDLGAAAAAGQKVLKIDVSNPASPSLAATVDLAGLDLKPFDGGMPVPRPYAVVEHAGRLWVALNNTTMTAPLIPQGPGLLVSIDPSTAMVTQVVDLGAAACLNPVAITVAGGKLYVSCAGGAVYDTSYNLIGNSAYGVVAYDPATGSRASWRPACAGPDAGCPLVLPSRLVVRDGRVYLGDQNAGRIFVADLLADGGFAERRGHGAGALSGPVQACGVAGGGYSNVADIISLP